jgi:hypothetical protein
LGRQGVARVRRESAHGLAGGEDLAAGALGECLGPEPAEVGVGAAQLLACLGAAVLASYRSRLRASSAAALLRASCSMDSRYERKLHGVWTPTARSTRHPVACAATNSTSAVLPIPASPRNTSTAFSPTRMRCSSPSSAAHSSRRPRSIQS